MNVVIVSQALAPRFGGAAVSEASLCAELQTRSQTAILCRAGALDRKFVLSFGLTGVKEIYPHDVVLAWLGRGHWLRHLLSNADIVHINGHWRWENILLARLAARLGTPFVLQPRGMLLLEYRKVWLKKIFNRVWGGWAVRRAGRLIALSQFEVRQWAPYSVPPNRCQVIANGISVPATVPPITTTPKEPYFLYLGRIETRKNLVFLVRAFARYLQAGGQSRLVLMGPVERRYDAKVREEAKRLKIEDKIQFHSAVYEEAKLSWMREARAVIYPAKGEPFGRVPFEAVAAGGIPIVPKESGSAEYLQGYLPESVFGIEDEAELVRCLQLSEKMNVEDRKHRVGPVQKWLAESLSWERVADRVVALYSQVIQENGAV